MDLSLLNTNHAIVSEGRLAHSIAVLLAAGVAAWSIPTMLNLKNDQDKERIIKMIDSPEVQRQLNTLTGKTQDEPAKPQELTKEEIFLARILFAETADQTRVAKEAVAQVILNRVKSNKTRYPNDIVGVITARNAFEAYPNSPMWRLSNDPGALTGANARAYKECEEVARVVASGELPNRIGNAILYHDTSIGKPWGPAAVEVARIGNLVFYKEVIIKDD